MTGKRARETAIYHLEKFTGVTIYLDCRRFSPGDRVRVTVKRISKGQAMSAKRKPKVQAVKKGGHPKLPRNWGKVTP
jgi:hypothetical protein